MIVWVLLIPSLAYAAGVLIISGWRMRHRSRNAQIVPISQIHPKTAILVAARNEEVTIERCLEALLKQTYPSESMAIYIADDHSTDNTAALVQQAISERAPGHPEIHLVAVPKPENTLRGKALAIHSAVQAASGADILLITDADCAPPPEWAEAMVSAFDDPDTGVVTARTIIDPVEGTCGPTLRNVQALDWAYLLTASSFMVEVARPITAMGNNMALRRAAYDEVGGYPALPFSVTEDYELFRGILQRTRWNARFMVRRESLVKTLPLNSLRDVFRQRKRWARGGLRAAPPIYGAYVCTHLARLLPVVLLFFFPMIALGAIGFLFLADFLLLRVGLEASEKHALRSFLAWELYFFAYVIILPLSLLFTRREMWKGRRL